MNIMLPLQKFSIATPPTSNIECEHWKEGRRGESAREGAGDIGGHGGMKGGRPAVGEIGPRLLRPVIIRPRTR